MRCDATKGRANPILVKGVAGYARLIEYVLALRYHR